MRSAGCTTRKSLATRRSAHLVLKLRRRQSQSGKVSSAFKRPLSDRFKKIKESWRKPRGIDSRHRRQFNGTSALPKVGFKSHSKTRGANRHGRFECLVQNVEDLKSLIMPASRHARKNISAVIGHAVSSKKSLEIVELAKKLNIIVENANSKKMKQPNIKKEKEAEAAADAQNDQQIVPLTSSN